MNAEAIARQLGIDRPRGTKDGFPLWKARCPLHAGKSDDVLHVYDEADGGTVIKCHGGCATKDVKAQLGISTKRVPPPIRGRTTTKRTQPEPEPPEPQPLPSGKPFWPPHIYTDQEGKPLLAVVRKDLGLDDEGRMRKTFIQFTPAGEDLWVPGGMEGKRPLFGRPKLLSRTGRIAVFEGEKCVQASEREWPTQLATTWAGGIDSWQYADWEPIRGREVSLLADTDNEGRTGMRRVAYYLSTEMECSVRIALPDGDSHDDVYDWLEQDGREATKERIENLMQPYVPDAADSVEPPRQPPEPLEGNLKLNLYYQILGLDGARVVIRIAAGEVFRQSRESLTQPSTLISLAPLDWWHKLSDSGNFGTTSARQIGDAVLREADSMGKVDLSRMTGRGALKLTDGRVAFHLGDRLRLDGEEVGLDGLDLDRRIWLTETRIEVGDAATDRDMNEIASAVMQYRWVDEEAARRFLGWIIVALVGGALDWRPHLFFSAPSTSGKSWMLKTVLDVILGPLMYKLADATPAAVANLTGNESLAIIIDEAEAQNQWVQDIRGLLRVSAGGEGMRVRADGATGGVLRQNPRFPALLSNTAMPELSLADASRFTVVQLGEAVEDWPKVKADILKAMKGKADAVRYRIIRRAPEIVKAVAKQAEVFENLGLDSREAMMSAALTAGWHAWGLDRRDVYSHQAISEDAPDAERAFKNILAGEIRLADGHTVTVLQALRTLEDDTIVADRYGIKRSVQSGTREPDGGLAIHPTHPGLKQLLWRTEWDAVDLPKLLEQLEGVTKADSPISFAGRGKKRGAYLVSEAALAKLELTLASTKDDQGTATADRQTGF